MIHPRILLCALSFILSVVQPTVVLGDGGTTIVATKGQPANVSPNCPKGTAELVNDPMRTSGWNSWFSEWPNDVNQYAFAITSTKDLNRLIEKLASIKSDIRQVRLSYMKEPVGLGWVTRVPPGNKIPVIFSIGDQTRINEWYKAVRKPFGVMEFTAAPIAVPPTLTIFVQNESVNLDELKIPQGIDISSGYVPTVFHRFNTTIEQQRKKAAAQRKTEGGESQSKRDLDSSSQAAEKRIRSFLESRKTNTAN